MFPIIRPYVRLGRSCAPDFVSSLAQEVGDGPVLLSQLDLIDAEREQLAAADSTSDQHCEDCVVSPATQ